MKQNVAKVISTTVLTIAKRSSSTVCEWRLFQPKVPEKLLEKKG